MSRRDSLLRLAEFTGTANSLRKLKSSLESRSLIGLGTAPASAGLSLYCVARARNAQFLMTLIGQLPRHVTAHVHALDTVPGELAPLVRSIGPGGRMELLRGLIEAHHRPGDELLIADDDVTFKRGNGDEFLKICRAGDFDVAQPAHALGSERSFGFVRAAVLTRARPVNFVEVGPLVWMSPRAQALLLPLEVGAGMGWGVDVEWSLKASGTLRMGIVDGAALIHHRPVAANYPAEDERAYLHGVLARAGVSSVDELVRRAGKPWRSWRQRPPWGTAPFR